MKSIRKITTIVVAFLLATILGLCLFACGGKSDDAGSGGGGGDIPPSLNQFTGITFSDLTVDYDGQAHKIEIVGTLPDGTDVNYTDNEKTNAGTYTAKAELSGDGYETKTLTATLKINKINVNTSSLAWSGDKTVDYNGQKHSLTVSGTLPDGVSAKYYYNNAELDGVTDAGTYTVKCVLSGANYNDTDLTETLTVNKIDIPASVQQTFAWSGDKNVEYDTLTHKLVVMGDIPSGVTAKYYYNDVECDGVSEVGSYTVKCVLSGPNYNAVEMTTTLVISTTEKQLYTAFLGTKVYFQNDLDGDRLYYAAGGNVTKVNNDVPNYMIADGNSLYYFGKSLLSSVIKEYDGNTASKLFDLSGEYLASDGGENLYYAVNNLLLNTDKNGIYKINRTTGANAQPMRLTSDKAKYVTYCGGYIYYANGSDGDRLYRISVNANNGTGTKLSEEKASYIITDGTNIYYNSTKTLLVVNVASAVTKYIPSSNTTIKLTTDSGKYLTKVGNYIYYINNDKLTSNLFGDGIYRVSAGLTSDSSAPGDKIVSVDGNGYSSLTSNGIVLCYYKLNDKHLYSYDITSNTETDLMANFTVQQDTSLSGYTNVVEHGGEIYFTNPTDSSRLYKYNPTTKITFLVLDDCVSNVYFDGDYMYYSTFVGTNYALFRHNMTTGGEAEKILGHRYEHLSFANGKVYGVRIAAIGSNSIVEIDPVAKTETEINKSNAPGVLGFEKVDNDYYYVSSKKIYKYDGTSAATIGTSAITATNLTVAGGRIYYTDDKALKSCTLAGGDIKTVYTCADINDIYASDGKVYFSSNGTNKGLYVYNITTDSTVKIDSNPASGMAEYNGKLYFLRTVITYTTLGYPSHTGNYDGRLYCYDGTNVTAA
ncbi:MAG: DUF5050 domain-containing protein [Clostridiales bacterium]|nr:DUF5050 domain-containing protein [Clostridiales bacterium]